MNFKCYKYKQNWHIIIKPQKERSRKSKKKTIKTKQRHIIFKGTIIIKLATHFSTETMKTRTKIEEKSTFKKSFCMRITANIEFYN